MAQPAFGDGEGHLAVADAAFLAEQPVRPKTVFTIHNLAYGGYFPSSDFVRLHLPSHWWSSEGVEFHGGFSMLKAGIVFADAVTTIGGVLIILFNLVVVLAHRA